MVVESENEMQSKHVVEQVKPNRNPNKFNKNKQSAKQLRRTEAMSLLKNIKDKNSQHKNLKENKNSSISDSYHKINYINQMSTLLSEMAQESGNESINILSNFYNQSLDKFILKNKSAINLSKNSKKFYCKKCYSNKRFNTEQRLLSVHDMSPVTAKSNKKSFLIQKTCKICGEKKNIYIGQNSDYISFEESNIN
ncbi:hypothetical protein QEN19_004104 [Hanseniaspora menglaensis]